MFGNDGKIVTGFKEWYGSYYYFDPTTYLKVVNQLLTVDGKEYYFDENGVRYTNKWLSKYNHVYYFGSDGAMLKNTTQYIGGKEYYFDNDGVTWNVNNG